MIPHSKPLIEDDDIRSVSETLASGNIAGGLKTILFEKKLSEYLGISSGVSLSSGTAGLFSVLKAMGVSDNDEVIIPAYVCSALLYAVKMTGASPVIADTSAEDFYHMDYDSVRKVLAKKTKAIIFPHMFGAVSDISDIIGIGIPVIEDCAMAVGAEYNGKKAGNLGSAASVFSFYATKVITTGEGGMVLSDDSGLIDKIRDIVSYADKKDNNFHFNFKMTDISAAIGITQLSKINYIISRRKEISEKYNDAFKELPFECPIERKLEKHIFYRYVVNTPRLEELRSKMHEKGVMAERPVYKLISDYVSSDQIFSYPNAMKALETSLSIPVYPAMSESDISFVIETVIGSAKALL